MANLGHLELQQLVSNIFEQAGAPGGHAQIVAKHLVESNLAGHDSHGVMRVSQYVDAMNSGQVVADAKPRMIHETPSGGVLDGQSAFGQVAAKQAMDLAMQKARETGIGAVTLRNCYHTGRLGAHSEMAVAEEMIGIVMVNAGGGGQSVAPFGGCQPRLATNPISIASPPADPFPLVLDIATSVAPEGKVRDLLQKKQPLPEGWIVDSEGRPSTNPQDFYEPPGGAIQALGGPVGYKGFGLAMMVDVLAGALTGAGACSEQVVPAKDGMLLMAIDVSQYGAIADFHRQVLSLIEHVKSCPAAPGFDEVYVPGEHEHRVANQRRRNGIEIPDGVWEGITSLAVALGVINTAHEATAFSSEQSVSTNSSNNPHTANPI